MMSHFPEGTVLPKEGDRIAAVRFVYRDGIVAIDDNITVPPDTEGTVQHADDLQVWVKWDNGSTINLVPGDQWRAA